MEWVKCSEKLPEKGGQYCVRLTNGCIATDLYTLVELAKKDSSYNWKTYLVAAWMRLPEAYYPYEEEESGWKRIIKESELDLLPDGDYFVTVRDLVYPARKDEAFYIAGSVQMPISEVEAVMSVAVYPEMEEISLFKNEI